MLQRASRRGRGEPAGGPGRCGSGPKRQAATRAGAGQDRNAAGRCRLFPRGECRGLREGRDRAADRHGPSAASSALTGRDLDGAARSRESTTGRSHGASDEDAGRQGSPCPAYINKLPNRFPASSKRGPDFRQFPLRGLAKVRGGRSLVTMAWNVKRMFAFNPA